MQVRLRIPGDARADDTFVETISFMIWLSINGSNLAGMLGSRADLSQMIR